MENKKKKFNLTSFAAGITAGGLVLVAGSITSIIDKAKNSLFALLVSVGIVVFGLLLYKFLMKRKKNAE